MVTGVHKDEYDSIILQHKDAMIRTLIRLTFDIVIFL